MWDWAARPAQMAKEAPERGISTPEDLDAVLRLLVEHTAELRSLMDLRERARKRWLLWESPLPALAAVALPIWLWLPLFSLQFPAGVVLVFLTLLAAVLTIAYQTIPPLRRYRTQVRSMGDALREAARRLERVVRLATHLADQSVENPVKRLEIELRIAEALAVLSYVGLPTEQAPPHPERAEGGLASAEAGRHDDGEMVDARLNDAQQPQVYPASKVTCGSQIGLQWEARSCSLLIANGGGGVATEICAILMGHQEGSSLAPRFSLWQEAPLAPTERRAIQLEVGGSIVSSHLPLRGRPLAPPEVPQPDVAAGRAAEVIARLTLTYRDLSGRKYASMFDYTRLQRWQDATFLADIPQDLVDLDLAARTTVGVAGS